MHCFGFRIWPGKLSGKAIADYGGIPEERAPLAKFTVPLTTLVVFGLLCDVTIRPIAKQYAVVSLEIGSPDETR